MSYQKDRDQFIARVTAAGVPLHAARSLLRASTTLQRLAEAQCNGDWPADNGVRTTAECAECGRYWASSVLLKATTIGVEKYCPDCRTEARVKALCAPLHVRPVFQGDPRGAVLSLALPGEDDERARWVPCR